MWGLKGDSGSVCACRFQLLHIKHYCGFLTFHDWRKINSGGDKRRKDTLYTLLFAMNWSAALQGGKKTEIKDGRSIRSPSNDSKWCTFENDARVSSSIKQSCSCCCSSNITGQAQIVYIKYITYGSIDLYLLCHLVNRRSQILIRYQQISCQLLVYKYVKVCVYCIEWKQMSRVFFTLINMKKILLKLWNLIFTKVIKIIDSYELLVFTLSEHSAAAPLAAATALTLCGDAAALRSCNTALQGLSGCITLSHQCLLKSNDTVSYTEAWLTHSRTLMLFSKPSCLFSSLGSSISPKWQVPCRLRQVFLQSFHLYFGTFICLSALKSPSS